MRSARTFASPFASAAALRVAVALAFLATAGASTLVPWMPVARAQPLLERRFFDFAGGTIDAGPTRLEPELETARTLDQALQRASDAFAGGQWSDGLDILVEAAQRDLGRLAPADDAPDETPGAPANRPRVYVSVESAAERFLARVVQAAPPLLEEYRQRYEPVAQAHLQEALDERDEAQLVAVYRRWFLARAAEQALEASAAWALERGDFALARARLERLHPLTRVPPDPPEWSRAAEGRPLWLALRGVDLSDESVREQAKAWLSTKPPIFDGRFYPDANVDVAELKARLAWISLLEGHFERAEVELAALRTAHPGATGVLAGQEGDLAEIVLAELDRARASSAARIVAEAQPFGELSDKPQWRLPVPPIVSMQRSSSGNYLWVGERGEALLPYFPVVWRDGLFWTEPASIRAVELESGGPLWSAFGAELPPPDKIGAVYQRPADLRDWTMFAASAIGSPRFTATIHGDFLLTRMGDPRTRNGGDFRSGALDEESTLVGLDLAAQGRLLAGFPRTTDEPRRIWEGSPVVGSGLAGDADRMYAAFRTAEPNDRRSRIGIACIELSTGATLWQRLVSSGGWESESPPSLASHVRPLIAEGKVLVDTGQGTLACLDAATGEPLWSIVYPYDDRRMRDYPEKSADHPPAYRDLARGVARRGIWYAAPQENDRIFAIEIHTGDILWESVPLTGEFAANHLLGFADGAIVASGRGLVWLDEISGRWLAQWPEPGQQVDPGHGKGLFVGDEILFPTERELLVFAQATERAGNFRKSVLKRRLSLADREATGGNLVYADPYLVIAGSDEIVAFKTNRGMPAPELSSR